jgi:pSer/pThr/pTyr-binding forkhead associated (FHA) protein
VLDDRDENGLHYAIRIPDHQLNAADGVVIVRNPKNAPFVINHVDVSRKHVRLKVVQSRTFIEDLGSTNGTCVNGQNIENKGLVAVEYGDEIMVGSVAMEFQVLQR